MKILLTGASGFVGSHALRHLLANTDWSVVCPVTFTHKGLPARIASALCDRPDWNSRVQIVHWDLRSPADLLTLRTVGECSVVWNIASESHVDRSISDPGPFLRNNTALMINMLELARVTQPLLFLQMSTDEVYGPAHGSYRHREWDPAIPSNPYSASKAAQEAIAISYWRTYGVQLMLTNTMNIIGEMQDPEKFLPKVIRSLYRGERIDVHTAPDGTPGSRFYLHARNLADAWLFLTQWCFGEDGPYSYPATDRPQRFHIVGDREVANTNLVYDVARIMGVDDDVVDDLIHPVSFHSSRPGHDLRYALDGSKLAALGWRAPVEFGDALARTVEWTVKHPEWMGL